jgi:hypothetical protein
MTDCIVELIAESPAMIAAVSIPNCARAEGVEINPATKQPAARNPARLTTLFLVILLMVAFTI